MQEVASHNAPSPSVVVPHFFAGGLSWLAIAGLVAAFPEALVQHYFNPKLLAIVHLFVSGFATMVIFGALYQLIPVILGVKLFSERLARASFLLLAAGAVLLAAAFWNFSPGALLCVAATLVLLAVLLFSFNIFKTASHAGGKSIERDFILTSVLWLVFTVVLGFVLALNLTQAFLPLSHLEWLKMHAHAGMVGWFLQLIIGVGSRLMPMFLVAQRLNRKKLDAAWYLINAGLFAGLIGVFLQNRWIVVLNVAMAAAGAACFLSFLIEAFRKRGKRQLDTGMKHSALSFGLLAVAATLLSVLLSKGRAPETFTLPLSVAYGSAWLGGFVTSLIMGQTYKTLPFIIWLKIYRKRVGKGKTPLPRDLYSGKMAVVQLWVYATGFFVLLAGVLLTHPVVVSVGGLLLLLSAVLYNLNLWRIIFHKPVA